jgi:hypothetical protein
MDANPPLLADQLGQPFASPQLGGETVHRGTVLQPAQGDFLLGGRQFAGTTSNSKGSQSVPAMCHEELPPTLYAAAIHVQKIGDLLGGIPIQEAPDREEPTVLKCSGRTLASHTENLAVRHFGDITFASSNSRDP